LEQQAKQRLTGGVILVVLLVLLVPELLTGPRPQPKPTPAQPDQAPMRSYTMDLGDAGRANSAPVAASTAVPPASEPAVRAAPPSAPASAPAPEATHTPPQPAATVSRTVPPPAAPTPRAPVAHGTAGWTVQLGTFSSRENAAHLVAGLKSHGFSASIAAATRGAHKLYRVRVGEERDRAAAQKLLARLRAAGEKGGEIVPR
jgi:cell division septation protein DedD